MIAGKDGRFFGQTRTNPFTTLGGNGTFQVRVWAAEYASYEAAGINGIDKIGKSALWVQNTAAGPFPPDAPVPIAGFDGEHPGYGRFTGIVVTVPEPSSSTLGLAGLGMMGLLRRRQTKPVAR